MAAGGAVLEETTATAGDILKGKTANDGEGEQIIGTLELTGDADAGEVLSGKTFYTTNPKSKQTGTMVNNGRWPDAEKLTLEGSKIWMYKTSGYTEGGLGIAASNLGNASSGHVLSGVSASSSNGLKFSGTMTNRGAWGTTLNPGGSVTVPQGYHSGGGKVKARAVNANDVIGKIHYASTTARYVSDSHKYILGVAGVNGTNYNDFLQFYLSSDHHTATWAGAPGSSWTYAYIDV